MIVVPEHGDHRDAQATTRIREHRGLLGQAVGRQVSCEQDQVAVLRGGGERARQPLTQRLHRVEVTRSCDS